MNAHARGTLHKKVRSCVDFRFFWFSAPRSCLRPRRISTSATPLEAAPLATRPVVVPPQTVLGPNLVPVPGLRVGGAFVYAPGLNGPDGPPAYPLLPFAFGYGY